MAIVVSRIVYALPRWGLFLNKELTRKINAFFKRAYRYCFTTKIMEVTSLLDNASKDLFCNMQTSPPLFIWYIICCDVNEHELWECVHTFVLPKCNSNLFKASFLNRCLFSLV